MKAVRVDYDPAKGIVGDWEGAEAEDWVEVCQRYHDDVHRIQDIADHGAYTGLYACFDEADTRCYYLVEEDRRLDRIRRKHFLRNLGMGG